MVKRLLGSLGKRGQVGRVVATSGAIAGMFAILAACSAPPTRPRPPATIAVTFAPTAVETAVATAVATAVPTDVAPTEEATTAAPASPSPTEAPAPTPVPTPNTTLRPVLQEVVDGLDNPTSLIFSGDGSGLLYVTEQPGRIRVIQDGALLDTPFLDITNRVGDSGNEQGLLSVVFPPDFAQSRKLYVNYTDEEGDTVVAGFIASADGLTADSQSEWEVLKIGQPYGNHNGGQLKFGPDGMLYIGMGDGGSAGDPQNLAQNRDELLGKMLRIDVSQSTAAAPYVVPASNPSVGKPEIWSLGLRNPWRFSFDRVTGDMFIADVGQNQLEEINFQPAASVGGENYGWKIREGLDSYSSGDDEGLTDPVWQYSHGDDGCSVTGGYVYRGPTLGVLTGAYVYGDYCSGKVWALRQNNGQWANDVLFETDYRITSFGEDAQGELYVLDRDGAVYKIVGE